MTLALVSPLPDRLCDAAAAIYWQGFSGKLGRVMGPEPRALRYVRRVLRPDHAIGAVRDGRLLGVVGFKTAAGCFVGGGLGDLVAVYGLAGGMVRGAALALAERDTDNDRFLMDGLAVVPEARGQGVGRALLSAIEAEAQRRGYPAVRLDVADTNPRARALYERCGYVAEGDQSGRMNTALFGFGHVTVMVKPVAA